MLKGKGIVTSFQKDVLTSFSKIQDSRFFYLAGGTALAEFYLGHRKSYDLDLFTNEKNLISSFSKSFVEEMSKKFEVFVARRFETFAEYEIKKGESVKLQLAYDSPFRFQPTEESELGVQINNFSDLIVDKLLAFYGRAEPRDAVDLFFILQTNDFWILADQARKKDPVILF